MMVAIVALIAGLALLVWSAWIFYLVPRISESSSECSKTLLFVENVEVVPGTAYQTQALYEEEVILSGTVDAVRLAAPYPFRYEGSASLVVEGSRFRFPFSLYVEYIIPLEGPYSSSIIPLVITANDQDFLHVGQALFSRIRN